MSETTAVGRDQVVEFSTSIRERPVACRWDRGEVSGDPELLDRMFRLEPDGGWSEEPASVARVISAAVPSPVVIRIVATGGV